MEFAFNALVEFCISLVGFLNDALINFGVKSLSDTDFTLAIFEPMFTLDLFTILVYFFVLCGFVIIYRLLKKLFIIPFKLLGVIK